MVSEVCRTRSYLCRWGKPRETFHSDRQSARASFPFMSIFVVQFMFMSMLDLAALQHPFVYPAATAKRETPNRRLVMESPPMQLPGFWSSADPCWPGLESMIISELRGKQVRIRDSWRERGSETHQVSCNPHPLRRVIKRVI